LAVLIGARHEGCREKQCGHAARRMPGKSGTGARGTRDARNRRRGRGEGLSVGLGRPKVVKISAGGLVYEPWRILHHGTGKGYKLLLRGG
jgi:hypothetical protein